MVFIVHEKRVSTGSQKFIYLSILGTKTLNIVMSSTNVALNATAVQCAALLIALIIIQCEKSITNPL